MDDTWIWVFKFHNKAHSLDTVRKLNVYIKFRRCARHLLNVLCSFNLRLLPKRYITSVLFKGQPIQFKNHSDNSQACKKNPARYFSNRKILWISAKKFSNLFNSNFRFLCQQTLSEPKSRLIFSNALW